MNSKVKGFFKIFLISLGSVVATMAVVVGIMFLCGVFKQPSVELKNMYFTVKDLKSDNNCYYIDSDSMISLVGTPSDTTEIDVNITFKQGENIITLPTSYKINTPFTIRVNKNTATLQNANVQYNVGGVVKLSAQNLDKTVACECTIFVDTFVEKYDLILTDENDQRIYLNEEGNAFYTYVENLSGLYGYVEESDEYKLITQLNNYNGKKFEREENLIYPGNVFYAKATNVFPINSLDTFKSLNETMALKTFEVDTDSESATIDLIENQPKAKITINSTQKITLSSFFVKSYSGMLKKAEIENRLQQGTSNDEEENMLKAELESLKVKSNTIEINPNPIQVTEIQADVTTIEEPFVVNTTTVFNSSKKSSNNLNGLGITLKAPIGSSYNDSDLDYRLSEMTVRTGYKSKFGEIPDLTVQGQNITLSNEYINATKVFANNVLSIEVECYKINTSSQYENYIVLSLDGFDLLIKCYIENESYPEIEIENTLADTILLKNSKNETITKQLDFSKVLLKENGTPVDTSKYKTVFVIVKDGEIDVNNDIIENEYGTVGSYVFVEDSNGEYGLNDSNDYELLQNLQNYQGKKYSRIFKDGLITLNKEKTGTLMIRACLVRKDFKGNIINFVENSNGEYGYYNGYYAKITEIPNYTGKHYSIGKYDVAKFSSNYITLNIETELEISGYTVLQADKTTEVPFKDGINDYDIYRDKTEEDKQLNPTIDLYLYEHNSVYIKVECNQIDKLYNEFVSNRYKIITDSTESHLDVGSFQRDYVDNSLYMFQIYAKTKHDSITKYSTINVRLEDGNGNILNNMQIRIHILDSQLKSIELNSSSTEIKAFIKDNYNVDWLDSTNNILKFEIDHSPKRFDLNKDYISYKYYSSYDNQTKTGVEDNSILKIVEKTLATDGKTYTTCEVYKTGIVYIVAVYNDEENDVVLTSNAIEITISADNLIVDDSNFVDDESILSTSQKEFSNKIYKNSIFDYNALTVNDLFGVSNTQSGVLDNRLLDIKSADINNNSNIKLEKNNEINSSNYNKFELSTNYRTTDVILVPIIVTTKTGQYVGNYWIKIVPNAKIEFDSTFNLSTTAGKQNIENKEYYFDISVGEEVDLSSIIVKDAKDNVNTSARKDSKNAKMRVNSNKLLALTAGEGVLAITIVIGQDVNNDDIYYTINIHFNITD